MKQNFDSDWNRIEPELIQWAGDYCDMSHAHNMVRHVRLECLKSLDEFTPASGRDFSQWLRALALDYLLADLHAQLVSPSTDSPVREAASNDNPDALSRLFFRAAFEKELARMERAIQNMAKRFENSQIAAEDLIAEALLHCLSQIDKGHKPPPGAPFSRWLRTMARNRMRDLVRCKSLPTEPLESQSIAAAVDGNPAEQSEREDMMRAVAEVLGSLSDRERMILMLKYFEDLSTEAIADIMDLPLTTVRPMLYRARQRCRQSFVSLHPELADECQNYIDSGRGRPAQTGSALSKPKSA